MADPTHPDEALTEQEDALLEAELGGEAVRLLLRSKTRIDTGRWLRKSPVWLCLTESYILLFAVSKRRYLQRMPIGDCKGTQYCHTSGALLMEPNEHWRFNTIALPPADGLKVLQSLQQPTETKPSPVTEPTGA